MSKGISAYKLGGEMESQREEFMNAAMGNPDLSEKGGIPDRVSGPSTVRSQTQTTTIAVDNSGDPWDLWVIDWDQLGDQDAEHHLALIMGGVTNNENNIFIDEDSLVPTTGCVWIAMQAGQGPFPIKDEDGATYKGRWEAQVIDYGVLNPTSNFLSGNVRVVGGNIKLEYTAPEITAQGITTQWSYPSKGMTDVIYIKKVIAQNNNNNKIKTREDYEIISNSSKNEVKEKLTKIQQTKKKVKEQNAKLNDASTVYIPVVVERKATPPWDVQSAMQLKGATQRKAYDGAFQNQVMDYSDNKPAPRTCLPKIYLGPAPTTGDTADQCLLFAGRYINTDGSFNNDSTYYRAIPTNGEVHGIIVSGLINEATFQLAKTVTLEQFPDASDDLLLSYAKASPLSNESLLEEYNNASRLCQQFWPASANAHGDFARGFKNALRTATKVAAVAAPMVIGGPMGIGMGATAAALIAAGQAKKSKGARAVNQAKKQNEVNKILGGMKNAKGSKTEQPRSKPPSKQNGNGKGKGKKK